MKAASPTLQFRATWYAERSDRSGRRIESSQEKVVDFTLDKTRLAKRATGGISFTFAFESFTGIIRSSRLAVSQKHIIEAYSSGKSTITRTLAKRHGWR